MKRKFLYTAIISIVLLFFSGVMICIGNFSVGKINWFQFPALSSTPIVELVYFDNELIYIGCFEKAVDINLNFKDLLIVSNLKNKIVYDVKRKQFISQEQIYNYQYAGNHDDSYITDFYNVETNCRTKWRLRAKEY